MKKRSRLNHSVALQVCVALEAIRGEKTLVKRAAQPLDSLTQRAAALARCWPPRVKAGDARVA
jgi:hypothetical protein